MLAFVFTDSAGAAALAAAVDASQGLPDPAIGTLRYAEILAHPDGARWSYPADDVTTPVAEARGVAPAIELDDSWFPYVDPHGGG